MTRDRIIEAIMQEQGRWRITKARSIAGEPVDPLTAQREHLMEIRTELERRLTEQEYLTCLDFEVFDVNCCDICHTAYPHYDMWDVMLLDGRHAWVCDPFRCILMSRIRRPPTADRLRLEALSENIVGTQDTATKRLESALDAAENDHDRVRAALLNEHHVFARKRCDEPFEVVVARTSSLLRTCVAIAATGYQG